MEEIINNAMPRVMLDQRKQDEKSFREGRKDSLGARGDPKKSSKVGSSMRVNKLGLLNFLKATTDESAKKVNNGLGLWGGTNADPDRISISKRPLVPPLGFQLNSPRKITEVPSRILMNSLSARDRGAGEDTIQSERRLKTQRYWTLSSNQGQDFPRSYAEMNMDAPRDRMAVFHETSRGTKAGEMGRGISKESSWSSINSNATHAPHVLSPPTSPTGRLPHKGWAERTGRYEEIPYERPMPHTLGHSVPSVVVTPDLSIHRWPAANTSTQWRSHARPSLLGKTSFYSPSWHSVVSSDTPRGYPAPGGGPNQHPKPTKNALTAPSLPRPQRPFTHASNEAAHHLLAEAKEFIWDKDRCRAVPKLELAIQIEPNFAEALALLGKLKQEDRQEHLTAESLFQRALILDPTNSMALAGMASVMENVRGDFDMANSLYERAVKMNPNDVWLLTTYALFVRNLMKDAPKARLMMMQALKLDPKHVWLRGNAHKF